MRLLLDTHALIWAVADPSRIPTGVREMLSDPAHEVLVSTVSAWEVAIKSALGRLTFDPVTDDLVADHGMRHLRIDLRHTTAVSTLAHHHRDPFDRLLIAQAMVHDLTLVSIDDAFADYDIDVAW